VGVWIRGAKEYQAVVQSRCGIACKRTRKLPHRSAARRTIGVEALSYRTLATHLIRRLTLILQAWLGQKSEGAATEMAKNFIVRYRTLGAAGPGREEK